MLARVEGRLFFANAQLAGEKLWALIDEAKPSLVVLDLSSVFDIEYTAIKMIAGAESQLKLRGITLWIVVPNPGVRAVLERSAVADFVGKDWFFPSRGSAIDKFEELRQSGQFASASSPG